MLDIYTREERLGITRTSTASMILQTLVFVFAIGFLIADLILLDNLLH